MTIKPKLFHVAEIDANRKIIRVLPEQLPFEQAKAKARELTKKYEPVAASHITWMQERRA